MEKFGRRGPIYWLMRAAERLTFAVADHVISTNESYAAIARRRGRKRPEQVTVVRSGPLLDTFRRVEAANRDLIGQVCATTPTSEQYSLFRAYLDAVAAAWPPRSPFISIVL